MSTGTLTPEAARRQRMIMNALRIYVPISMLAAMIYYLVLWPPSPAWGIPDSPQRQVLRLGYALLASLPFWIWGTYRFSISYKWIAQDLGVPYEPGKKYPLFHTKMIVAVALGIALFSISGAVPFTTFDLAQFVATFVTLLYGPVAGGLAVGLGDLLIRGPIFMGWLDPAVLLYCSLVDGSIYFVAGHFYRQYIYGKPIQWRLTIGLLAYFLVVNAFHWGWFIPGFGWGIAWQSMGGPLDWIRATRAWNNFYGIPFSVLPNLVLAYIVSSSIQKYKV
jgi:hypothetical protein